MNVLVEDSFVKDTMKIKDRKLAARIGKLITDAQSASSILDIRNLKKLEGFKDFYRVRIGDYRAGFKLEDKNIRFLRFMHRKDIYKHFPKP